MDWFRRHLNWTAFLIPMCSIIVGRYLVNFIFDIADLSIWGPKYPPNTLDVMLPWGSSFPFDIALLLANIPAIVAFRWVLTEKNRNLAYLLFFIAFVVWEIPVFLSYIVDIPFTDVFYTVRMITFFLWPVGWVIIMALKNKSANTRDIEEMVVPHHTDIEK